MSRRTILFRRKAAQMKGDNYDSILPLLSVKSPGNKTIFVSTATMVEDEETGKQREVKAGKRLKGKASNKFCSLPMKGEKRQRLIASLKRSKK